MALIGVQAPAPRSRIVGAHKGGEETGQMVGGAIGGVFGAIAGGTGGAAAGGVGAVPGAIAGGIGGAAGGAAVGGKIGGWISPSSGGHEAIDRRVEAIPQIYHSERSDTLRQGLAALSQQSPEMRDQYGNMLVAAYVNSLANDHTGSQLAGSGDKQYGA